MEHVCLIVCGLVWIMFQTLVNNNRLSDRVFVIAGKIEEVDVPEQVDVIISEPMGYMLFNERMLETFLHAKKWLRPGGTLVNNLLGILMGIQFHLAFSHFDRIKMPVVP